MMAFGHATSCWCVGLLAGSALGLPADLTLSVAGGLAGAGLIPDLDHHGSTATTAFGPASRLAHRGVVALHHLTCAALRRPGDGKAPGAHRGVTHWWPFPLVGGGATAVACAVSEWAAWGLLTLLFTLAIRGLSVPEYRENNRHTLRRRAALRLAHGVARLVPTIAVMAAVRRRIGVASKTGVLAAGGVLAWLAVSYGGAGRLGGWWGAIVGAGLLLHVVGDAPTESGVPGWRLWSLWRLPKEIAFKAGGWFEVGFLWIPLSVAGVLLIPGVWPVVAPLLWDAGQGAVQAWR